MGMGLGHVSRQARQPGLCIQRTSQAIRIQQLTRTIPVQSLGPVEVGPIQGVAGKQIEGRRHDRNSLFQ